MELSIRVRKVFRPLAISCTFLFFGLLLSLSACNLYEPVENKSSDKAKMEKAAIYIDKGQYEKAENIANKIYNKNPDTENAKLLQLLSNSISGKIGIDSFSVLEIADDLDDVDNSGAIDLVGRVLGDDEATLTKDKVKYSLDALYKSQDGAIFFLEQIGKKTMDHYAQLGLLSIFDTVLLIGDIIMFDLGDTTIKLTEEGIKNRYNELGIVFPNNPDLENYVKNEPADFTRIERLNRNVKRIEESIDAILALTGSENPEDNDLADIFNDFLEDVTHEDKITLNSLVFYITGIL